ncbi:MAG TPA: cellulase family glycosylhydrolase [Sphingomonas sp.]|uniref:glycoside hydrolase family 5 protein n=1 Tax=Sphingomonas sp. TaxID=28214 RepID=UPI002D0BA3CD|nr:cellulase family glycosylhydrolase [Sphingomonas sp.]HMI18423.1 cellulase family glycosylhydrolase [Sphingomonas sp.]
MKRLILALSAWLMAVPACAADLIAFWNVPEHGGNSFNGKPPSEAYFRALRGYGATWVRLTPSKWKGEGRDFLIGDADHYAGIPPQDLKLLVAALDRAQAAGLKVVVTPLSLPGARWSQQNGNKTDGRLWRDKDYWAQSAAFWRDLAQALKDHPAVAGYNIVNEPIPEKDNGLKEHSDLAEARAWYRAHQGSAADLRAFYATVILAIRAVDPKTPIMLDMGWYAAADAFTWDKLPDDRLLYAFHMYEPYDLTSLPNIRRTPPLPFPGKTAYGDYWDTTRLDVYLQQPVDWARAQGVPANRIVAAEFGCGRRLPMCPIYLEDVLAALDRNHLHWAFYGFREDEWDAMDYELGAGPPPPRYWDQIKTDGDAVKRGPNPVFDPISRRLAASKPAG